MRRLFTHVLIFFAPALFCVQMPGPGTQGASAAPEPSTQPGSDIVVCEANTPVRGGRRARARKRAISKALLDAVTKKARDLLPPRSQPKLFTQLRAHLKTRSRRYVRSYRVLSERFEKGPTPSTGAYVVKLRVSLDLLGVKRLVAGLQKKDGNERPQEAVALRCSVSGTPGSLDSASSVLESLVAGLSSLGYRAKKAGSQENGVDEDGGAKKTAAFELTVKCGVASSGKITGHGSFGSTVSCRGKLRAPGGGAALLEVGLAVSGIDSSPGGATTEAQKLAGAAMANKLHRLLSKRFSSCLSRFELVIKGPLGFAQQRKLLSRVKQALPSGAHIRPARYSRGRLEAVATLVRCRSSILQALTSVTLPSTTIRLRRVRAGRIVMEVSLDADQTENPESP